VFHDLGANAPAPASAPFGPSLQFLPLSYGDRLAAVAAPVVQAAQFFPAPGTVGASGLIVELWFKAASAGMLISQPMASAASGTERVNGVGDVCELAIPGRGSVSVDPEFAANQRTLPGHAMYVHSERHSV
jgi:hypothetical protein